MEAERAVGIARVRLNRFELSEAIDTVFRERDHHYLDLCVTPRNPNARGCYPQRWGPHRFERIGDLFMVPSGESLRAQSDCGRQVSVVCELSPTALDRWFEGEPGWDGRRLAASLDIASAPVRALLFRIADELRNPGFASDALVELVAAQIGLELARHSSAVGERKAGGGLAPWRLRLIDERLAAGGDLPTLAELAGLCGISVRQLTRGFRESRGCSLGEHMERQRLAGAMRLLEGDQSVKAIAYAMGFRSPSSFSYAFRRATGRTPREYRERARG